MTRAIIFDFFGVLCPDLYWVWLKKHVPNFRDDLDFYRKLINDFDLGHIDDNRLAKILSEKSAVAEKEIIPQLKSSIAIDEELVSLIKKLKANYKIGLLSNAGNEFINEILNKYDLIPLFDAIVVSEEAGFRKPDKEIFQIALEKLEIKPEEAVFIDDNQINIDAAKKLGINALLYEAAGDVEADLKALGVKF